jgi:hypothetical protein
MTFNSFEDKQYEVAAKAAENLDFTWDETSLCFVRNGASPADEQKVDHLMDLFINPIRNLRKPADPKEVEASFKAYISELEKYNR